jgi:hypothetical protein
VDALVALYDDAESLKRQVLRRAKPLEVRYSLRQVRRRLLRLLVIGPFVFHCRLLSNHRKTAVFRGFLRPFSPRFST